MDSEKKYCALVYDVLSLIDGYAAKSKRATFATDQGWIEYVQGYADLLARSRVHPVDIRPAALEHVRKSQYFPTPHEMIERAKTLAYHRMLEENRALKELPMPEQEPISEEFRVEIKAKLEAMESRIVGHLTAIQKPDRVEFQSWEAAPVSEARKASIENAKRLRLKEGGAA